MTLPKPLTLCALALSILSLTACQVSMQYPEGEVSSSAARSQDSAQSSAEALPETQNVTYAGIVRPAGITMYQEGTHRLEISSKDFVLLQADSGIDLNGYVDERVQVTGAVRPTIEAGATIMRVEQISLLEQPPAVSSQAESIAPVPVQQSSVAEETEEQSVSSVTQVPVPKPSAQTAPVSKPEPVVQKSSAPTAVVQPSSETVSQPVDAIEPSPLPHTSTERVLSMSKDSYDASRWTQPQYCNTSAGFCIPIHKNWWYKSFQGTLGHVWYMEFSNAEIENVGDGPISLKIVGGDLSSKGASDGELKSTGSIVTGYKTWTNGNHIEVTADVALIQAVQYLITHITSATASTSSAS